MNEQTLREFKENVRAVRERLTCEDHCVDWGEAIGTYFAERPKPSVPDGYEQWINVVNQAEHLKQIAADSDRFWGELNDPINLWNHSEEFLDWLDDPSDSPPPVFAIRDRSSDSRAIAGPSRE